MAENEGTFSGSGEHELREPSGPLELAYLNLVRLKPGTTINGRYRLERLVGQGGFGIVFEALDETLGAPVAVKFLNPRLTRNERKFLRVRREINLSRRISDERIIKVFSLESWREIQFLVMELAAGASLKSLLEEKALLAWPEFKGVFLDIVEAVAVLHANGIVHRDLKPANILIGERQRVKILDFGLAKEVDDAEKTSTTGEIVGSPYYMSPEQIRGLDAGFASDVYQLGLVLYRTLAGRHPFDSPSTMEVILGHLHRRPEPPAPATGGLPRFLRLGLDKALEKAPARRFRDAGAMARFFRLEKASWGARLAATLSRAGLKWALGAAALAVVAVLGYRASFGARAVHALNYQGSSLEARNRFGVRLWRRDFSPFLVQYAYQTKNRFPIPSGWGIASEYRVVEPGAAPVSVAVLMPPSHPVFPASESISSAGLLCRRAIVDEHGRVLRQEPMVAEYEYDAYDYLKVVKPHAFQRLGMDPGGETDMLFTVQQYQSMYPFAMVFNRGLRKHVFTHPGTFAVTPLARGAQKASFMLFGLNNLIAHMSFIAEISFNVSGSGNQLMRGIPNSAPDEHNIVPHEDMLLILPFRSRLLENRWPQEGRARISEEMQGDILEVDRAGRLRVQTKGGRRVFFDPPDTLRRVYALINSSYQEKMVKRNPRNALALITQACSFPLQNPYLRSALAYLQGDLEIDNGEYSRGERSLQRALELYRNNIDASERLCEMDVLKGEPEAALRRLAGAYADSTEFWGFTSFGVQLFRGYVHLHMGMFSQAGDEFSKLQFRIADLGALCQATGELFRGNYDDASAALLRLEKQPLGNVDLRELRLLIGRALLLTGTDPGRAEFLFDDISRNSLEYGHLAELSSCYYLARAGDAAEAGRSARLAFTRLRQRARGDVMTRLWLFYDAYVYALTMELANDRGEAARGYRACVAANPYTELAARSRRRLGQPAEERLPSAQGKRKGR